MSKVRVNEDRVQVKIGRTTRPSARCQKIELTGDISTVILSNVRAA